MESVPVDTRALCADHGLRNSGELCNAEHAWLIGWVVLSEHTEFADA